MSEITVVRVPSVWSCKLSRGLWLNLAHARKLSVSTYNNSLTARIFWADGKYDTFGEKDAQTLIDAWERAHNMQRDINEGDRDS